MNGWERPKTKKERRSDVIGAVILGAFVAWLAWSSLTAEPPPPSDPSEEFDPSDYGPDDLHPDPRIDW